MILYQRALRTLVIATLLLTPAVLLAQDSDDSNPTTITGSQIARPLFEAYVERAEAEFDYETAYNGDNDGFLEFCQGAAAVTNTTRPMSVDEQTVCEDNDVTFHEFLLGYDILAYIADPSLEFASCVSTLELDSIFAPSAAQNTIWNDIIAGEEEAENDIPVNVFLPPADALSFAILDQTISGVGFRADAETGDSIQAVINAVAETEGAFAAVPFSALPDEVEDVQVVELRNNNIASCVSPSAENVFDESYLAGTGLYSYVNADVVADDAALQSVYEAVASADAADAAVDAGFTAPITDNIELNAAVLGGETGRQFSRSLTAFQIPQTLSGPVTAAGAAGAFQLLDRASTSFTQQYGNVTVTVETRGVPDGLRRLCNDEIDFAATYAPLSDETLENCAAVDIDVMEIEVGEQAAVLVANAADAHLQCLSTEDITTTWQASTEASNWQAVNEDYPDQDFVLFADSLGDPVGNMMMVLASSDNTPIREDLELDSDHLYRAAAVANTEGALTYMSWGEYQDVLDNEQADIQLVQVDGGEGCVMPTEDTIESGEYPLARTLYIAVNQQALEESAVQSFLWFTFNDDRFTQFTRANFDLLTLNDLADIRETLQAAYDEALEAAATRAAEAAEAAESVEEPDAETQENSDE